MSEHDIRNEAEEEFRVAPVTRQGSPMRWRLEQLLREHRWEEALDQLYCMSEVAPTEQELISRCIGLVEQKLVRGYERSIGDRDRAVLLLMPDAHPAWHQLGDDARRVGALVNGLATFDDIIEESALGRFAALRELARLVDAGFIGGAHDLDSASSPIAVELAARVLAPARGPRWPLAVASTLSAMALAFGVALAWGLVDLDPADPPPPPPPVAAVAVVRPVVTPLPPPPEPVEVPVSEPRPPLVLELPPEPALAVEPAPPSTPAKRPKRAAPPIAKVAVDNVSIDGTLTTRDLARAVERLSRRFGACPDVPRKPMPLRAVIVYDRRGEVTLAAVSGASAPAGLRGCLRQALEHLQLDTARPGRASFTVELAAAQR